MTQFSNVKDWDEPAMTDREIEMEIETSKDSIYDALKAAGWSHEDAERMIDEAYHDEANPRFAVDDASSAEWVLRKMAECEEEIKAISQRTQDEVLRLTAKADRLTEPIKRRLRFFTDTYREQLENYAIQQSNITKRKTVKLLYGEISIKAGSKSLEWVGNETEIRPLIQKAYPEAVQTVVTHQLMKNPIKEAFKNGFNGIIDGVQVAKIVTADEKIEVKPCLP